MSKGVKSVLWILVLLVPVVMLVYPRLQQKNKGPAPAAAKNSDPLPVEVYRVHPEPLEEKIKVQGSVMAAEEAELRCEIAGMITAILFEEGKPVTKGKELVKIDDKELQAEKTRLTFDLDLARETEGRFRSLLSKGSVSRENYDRALNQVNTLEAQLQVVAARLAKTVIRAPFDGIVGFRNVSEGAYITSNTRIATIQKIDTIKIEFAVPEKYAAKVARGNRIAFHLTGHTGAFEGEVYAVEPKIDSVTRTLPIRAFAANPDGSILPGSFAEVALVLDEVDDALMAPTESIIPSLGGQRLYVVEDGKAASREVTVGVRTPTTIEILSGVRDGDLVIRTGLLQVRDGLPVRIIGNDGMEGGGAR